METINFVVDILSLIFAAASGITALIIWLTWIFKRKNKDAINKINEKIKLYESRMYECGDESARMMYQEKIDELKEKLPKSKSK